MRVDTRPSSTCRHQVWRCRPRASFAFPVGPDQHSSSNNAVVSRSWWTETFGTERLTGALLDRLTHHVDTLKMNGDSYRLAQSRTRKPTDTA